MGAWESGRCWFFVVYNYITEIMSVLLGLAKRRQSARRLESAIQASPARFPSFGVVTPDLFVRRLGRNAIHTFGPSVHPVRLWSSQARFLTMQVPRRADVTPNPIADNVDYRIPWDVLGRLWMPIRVDTTCIACPFPAALLSLWISS